MPEPVPASANHLMRPILWTFGEGPTFPGYTDDTRWNGFLNVSVSMATWPYVLRTLIAGADGDAYTIAAYREMAGGSMVSLAERFTTEAVDRNWPWQFRDYPVATMMPIPERWSEMSWHHDTAPSFGPCVGPMGEAAQVWVDYADPSKREFPEAPRFSFSRRDAVGELTTIYAGADWDEVLTLAAVEALACAFARGLALELTPAQWQDMRLRNRVAQQGTCASHDFVDANTVMLAAWEAERGHPLLPTAEPAIFEDDLARVNAAWKIATAHYLTASEEGERFDAWRLTARDVDGLAAAGEELGRVDDSDSPGRIYATGFMERGGSQWIVNVGNSSQAFDELFDAEAHLWSVHASTESRPEVRQPLRLPPPPSAIHFTVDEITVTADAIDRRLATLAERMETVSELSSEGLFLAESARRLKAARVKLTEAAQP